MDHPQFTWPVHFDMKQSRSGILRTFMVSAWTMWMQATSNLASCKEFGRWRLDIWLLWNLLTSVCGFLLRPFNLQLFVFFFPGKQGSDVELYTDGVAWLMEDFKSSSLSRFQLRPASSMALSRNNGTWASEIGRLPCTKLCNPHFFRRKKKFSLDVTATGARLEEDKVRPLLKLLQLKVCADGSGSDDIGLQKRQRLAGKSMFTHLQFGHTHTQYVTYMFFSPHMMRVSGAFF